MGNTRLSLNATPCAMRAAEHFPGLNFDAKFPLSSNTASIFGPSVGLKGIAKNNYSDN